MAIFGSKKNKEVKTETDKAPQSAKKTTKRESKNVGGKMPQRLATHILKRPRITEKASILSETSIYVFDVDIRANKKDVFEAIRFYYKAEPVKVRMITVPSKNVIVRGKRGVKTGGKKAYVYLKKGETMEII